MSSHVLFSSLIPPLTRTSIRICPPCLTGLSRSPQCRPTHLRHKPSHDTLRRPKSPQQRPFTTTPRPPKKQGGKGASKRTVLVNSQKTSSFNDADDPTDFSALEAQIERIVAGLREEVKRIKPGGVDVQAVEDVRVTLKKGGSADKGEKEVVKVGELAQVVPRGRVLLLLVGEKEVCYLLGFSQRQITWDIGWKESMPI